MTSAQTSAGTSVGYAAASLDMGLTRAFSEFVAAARYEDLPEAALSAARRGVLDWLGCALAGARHPTIDILVETLAALGGPETATVIGRGRRLGLLEAALANGQMGHVLDFDDTHMGGVILHASSPILAALLALAQTRRASGRDLALAYALGFEAGVRTGQAAPDHHAGGWHLTGTLGTIAAGVAAAKLLKLDAAKVANAIAVSATQAAGMQQNRGTMSKSFHAGKAASNGLLAALLAERGFDGSDESLEGRRGFCRIYSARTDEAALLRDLGRRWEIVDNGHKPYACGVVLHPAIDAMIALGRQGPAAAAVAAVELKVNPAAVAITGVVNPKTGLKSKFSLSHTSAVAFLDGAAGIAQFTDARAGAADVAALAARIAVTTDAALARDQAEATLVLADGSRRTHRVEHASGTVANPMRDAALMAKFLSNATPTIGVERAAALCHAIGRLTELDDVAEIAALAG